MRKIFASMLVLLAFSATFISCSKDDEESASNSITIQGEFTVGNKTFTNPTFDLGDPADLTGYLTTYYKAPGYNVIVMENDYIDLGNNIYLSYDFDIYSATAGSDIEMSAYVAIYDGMPTKSNLYIYGLNALATITKVGDVGEYIEGTFEGDFDYDKKGVIPPFHVKGKFKVKRVEEPTVY